MTNNNKQSTASETSKLTRKVGRLKQLLARYKQTKSMQYAMLQLSEFASSVTDMAIFHRAMQGVIGQLMQAENFYVVMVDPESECFTPVYFSDQTDNIALDAFDSSDFESGLTGYVYKTRQSLLCDKIMLHEMAARGDVKVNGTPASHWMGIPLIRGHKAIGVIAVQTYNETRYNETERELLELISLHLVTAIDRVKQRELLEQDVRNRTRELSQLNHNLQVEINERQRAETLQSALFKISQITATAGLMDDFYQSIHEVLKTLIYAENCYIALISDDGQRLSFPFFADEKRSKPEPRQLGKGLTEYVIQKGEAWLINRNDAEQLAHEGAIYRRQNEQTVFTGSPTSWLGAPLIINDEVIGVITTQSYNEVHQYSQKELDVLCFVSHHLAVAIQRKLASDQLHNSYDVLEDKVLTRTQELRQSNLFLKLQIEERKKAEKKLYFEANHDALTALPNRKMLLQRLEQAIIHKKRHQDHHFAVLFIDLDRFKIINDTMGHHVGDQFLIEVSLRIAGCIRDNDILARLGGDEFVILLDMIQSLDDAEEITQRIITSVGAPYYVNEQEVYSGASVGIAECKPIYQTADDLLRDADAAMYQAKAMGRGRFIVFDETMHQRLVDDLNIDQALHRAVKEKLLFPAYFDFHNVQTGEVLGCEAKTCWHHPELGDVEQSFFAELAETNGLITQIDQQILTQVCDVMKPGGILADVGLVSVNVSSAHLSQSKSLQQLLDIVKLSNVDSHKVCFEFAEQTLLKLPDINTSAFKRIKNAGIRIAIQGFGSGVSSLGLLTQNPIDYVKADRDFTRTLAKNSKNKALLDTLITLSLAFDFKVILEGIDSEILQKLAEQHQVYIAQGQYFKQLVKRNADAKPALVLRQLA